ncbi:DnaE-like error-prone DNA polymerase [Dongia mobilis]|uniref:Error-prone DNA polymerase n=1 Tax=Dongia mobilis TaxID=578943 RepID=A0A4R6WVQ2_9PROT|nr:error-prone DNA polymerase [Dongia mobilis]TDQ83406.1 DnaE-like error-prone DNA polymerase [Dongia mobilis]
MPVVAFPETPADRGGTARGTASPPYVELSAMTNYSFLEAASHAEELALAAAALGMNALGIADGNSLSGIVRALVGCEKAGIRLLVGCRLRFRDAPDILVYPRDRAAYGRLSELLTLGRRRAPKGACHLDYADLAAAREGMVAILVPPANLADSNHDFAGFLRRFRADFGADGYLALAHLYRGDDLRRLILLQGLADAAGLASVAINEVRYHVPARKALHDVLTCVREGCTIDNAGYRIEKNAERHLKDAAEMRRLFRGFEAAVARSAEIAGKLAFSLRELRYEYPEEVVTPGETPLESLKRFTWEGAAWRYPDGVTPAIRAKIEHEFALIEEMDYARYFLTVRDIVREARRLGILHQGRGSAANSVVCYCLGITAIDPVKSDLLFERFISTARNEPPDIDVDFEHERREEIIQYIYGKYGRHRAGLAATIICYRSRAALRDVGRVMGLSEDAIGRIAKTIWGWSQAAVGDAQIREAGLDPADRRLRLTLDLARELTGMPRHLSQHVGGFVISKGPLSRVVPIENAAMADRTVIQWDKDDLEALGLMKVDILALGMLSCIRRAFDFLRRHEGRVLTLANVPAEDPATYDMLCAADSVGVFQVESRAQMSMLPRLRPRSFYDLVIEVAIVRPGPIQGDMVHPYLRRRDGKEPSESPQGLQHILRKTHGVPLFQEQVMKIAIDGAGFSPTQADELRRSMAAFKKVGTIQTFRDRFMAGMLRNGYAPDFADRCFRQIEGFANYGFPESHAASFALLVYVSAWLKCHYPVIFAAALLNSQPMGFYAPAQIVHDADEHGVVIRPVDVNVSDWDNDVVRLDAAPKQRPLRDRQDERRALAARVRLDRHLALQLGFRQITGLKEAEMRQLAARRGTGYRSVADLWQRARLSPATLARLAEADAFRSLGLDRRQALWAVKALGTAPLPLLGQLDLAPAPPAPLPEMPLSQHVLEDYRSLRLSLKKHPLAFLREILRRRGVTPCHQLGHLRNGQKVFVAGLVLVRQRPGTASGVIFMTLEDEYGIANLVVWPRLFSEARAIVMGAHLVGCQGRVQIEGKAPHQVVHVVAERLVDMTGLLDRLREDGGSERLAHQPARADEVTRPQGGDARERKAPPVSRGKPALASRSRDFH